jgi:hypothetical protein
MWWAMPAITTRRYSSSHAKGSGKNGVFRPSATMHEGEKATLAGLFRSACYGSE